MVVPEQERRIMKAALEMAVQESLSHPNIVRVFSCMTDMVEECGACTAQLRLDARLPTVLPLACCCRCIHSSHKCMLLTLPLLLLLLLLPPPCPKHHQRQQSTTGTRAHPCSTVMWR